MDMPILTGSEWMFEIQKAPPETDSQTALRMLGERAACPNRHSDHIKLIRVKVEIVNTFPAKNGLLEPYDLFSDIVPNDTLAYMAICMDCGAMWIPNQIKTIKIESWPKDKQISVNTYKEALCPKCDYLLISSFYELFSGSFERTSDKDDSRGAFLVSNTEASDTSPALLICEKCYVGWDINNIPHDIKGY